MAPVVHRGAYRTIDEAYAVLFQWIEANAYRVAGADREIYLQGGTDPEDASNVTEIQLPVEEA